MIQRISVFIIVSLHHHCWHAGLAVAVMAGQVLQKELPRMVQFRLESLRLPLVLSVSHLAVALGANYP